MYECFSVRLKINQIQSRIRLSTERQRESYVMTEVQVLALQKKIEADLLTLFGSPLLTVSDMTKALNYSSAASIHQSISKKTFPIKVFNMPNRREKFALTSNVASYLAEQALKSDQSKKGEEK
jgi:hypothetical protein